MLAVPPESLSFVIDSDGACPPAKFYKLLLEKIDAGNLDVNEWIIVLH